MLASQRLRRAATCAADRTRLRQLMELPVPVAEVLAEVAHEQPAAIATAVAPPYPPLPPEPTPAAVTDTDQDNPAELRENQGALVFVDLPAQVLEPMADQPAAGELAAEDSAEDLPAGELPASEAADQPLAGYGEPAPPLADELPAQAPPIRPPAASTARAEFGLATAEPAEIMAYQLPELAAPEATTLAGDAPPTPLRGRGRCRLCPGGG